jgi:hypothetical protein
LQEIFHRGEVFPLGPSSPGGFFPETKFGNIFPGGSTFPSRGNPLGESFVSVSIHAPGGFTILVGTHASGSPQPSSSTNIGGTTRFVWDSRDFTSLRVFIFTISFPRNCYPLFWLS